MNISFRSAFSFIAIIFLTLFIYSISDYAGFKSLDSVEEPTFLDEYVSKVKEAFFVFLAAYFSFIITWPLFIYLEKKTPALNQPPRSNYIFNLKVILSNIILTPIFAALVVIITIRIVDIIGIPCLELSVEKISLGHPLIDFLAHALIYFIAGCFMGDFWFYWWHRLEHKVPFLWELHKLHHSDENLNASTVHRGHFLEPVGAALIRGLTLGLIFDSTAPPQTILAAIAGGLLPAMWDYLFHSNIRTDIFYRLMPYFSAPQYHWIHHSRLPKHKDKNFANFFLSSILHLEPTIIRR